MTKKSSIRVEHQYSWQGAHRVVLREGGIVREGKWALYQEPAHVNYMGKRWTAFTDYFGERIEVSTTPEKWTGEASITTNCQECGEEFEVSDTKVTKGCTHIHLEAEALTKQLERIQETLKS